MQRRCPRRRDPLREEHHDGALLGLCVHSSGIRGCWHFRRQSDAAAVATLGALRKDSLLLPFTRRVDGVVPSSTPTAAAGAPSAASGGTVLQCAGLICEGEAVPGN